MLSESQMLASNAPGLSGRQIISFLTDMDRSEQAVINEERRGLNKLNTEINYNTATGAVSCSLMFLSLASIELVASPLLPAVLAVAGIVGIFKYGNDGYQIQTKRKTTEDTRIVRLQNKIDAIDAKLSSWFVGNEEKSQLKMVRNYFENSRANASLQQVSAMLRFAR